MQEQDNGPEGLLAEIGAHLGGERFWDAWEVLDELTEDVLHVLSSTSQQLEGWRIPRPDLPRHRADYERLAEQVKAARVAFDAEVAETVRLLDQRAAWRVP